MLALLNVTHFVSTTGYAAIFLLSVAQSCCIPTSSELTMGFAGYLAATGHFSLAGVIVAGAGGEWVGAFIAWEVGRTGARAFVDRFGRYILLSHRDLDRAEAWFQRHPRWGVLGSRLVPVIRNFAALAGGIAEVPIVRFGALTLVGSVIWDGAMAGIGYGSASHWKSITNGFSDAGYVLALVAVVLIGLLIIHRIRTYREDTASEHV